MNIRACTHETDRMSKTSQNNHEMENLVACTKDIKLQGIPAFRYLWQVSNTPAIDGRDKL